MAISVKHAFTSPKSDGADTTLVQPSNWNAEHTITAAAGKVLGRDTSGAGAIQELPIAVDVSGKVGIGTDTPGAKLDARGDILATDGTNGVRLVGADGNIELYRSDSTPFIDFKTATAEDYDCRIQQASNGLAFSTGGNGSAAERMRIDSAGNVGIGTSAPGRRLSIKGGGIGFDDVNTNTRSINWGDGTTYWTYISGETGTGALIFGTNTTSSAGVERMRITSAGDIGVGTSAPNGLLSLGIGSRSLTAVATYPNADISGINTYYLSTDGSRFTDIYAGGAPNGAAGGSNLRFLTNAVTAGTYPVERMRIDSAGNVGIGTTTSAANPGIWLDKNGTVAVGNAAQATGWGFMYFKRSDVTVGSITQNGTTAVLYNTTSDRRLKENIFPADEASSLIDAIQVRKFDWAADGTHQRYGFIAQELVTVAPEAVHVPENEDEMMAVDYSKLVPMLVKEIQSLRARVAQLEGN